MGSGSGIQKKTFPDPGSGSATLVSYFFGGSIENDFRCIAVFSTFKCVKKKGEEHYVHLQWGIATILDTKNT